MKKTIIATPIGILVALALLIAWVNWGADKDAAANEANNESEIKYTTDQGTAKKHITTAWDHWSRGGAVQEENMKMDIAFIAIRAIDKNEMNELGMEQEFNKLQDITYIISGGHGRLTEQEKQIYYKKFEDSLSEIHSALN